MQYFIREIPREVNIRLKEYIFLRYKTLTGFAKILGITKQSLSKTLNGSQSMKHDTLFRICKELGEEPHNFLNRKSFLKLMDREKNKKMST